MTQNSISLRQQGNTHGSEGRLHHSPSVNTEMEIDRDTMRTLIEGVKVDVQDIEAFYSCNFSKTRIARVTAYFRSKLEELATLPFEKLDLESQTDYILIRTYLRRQLRDFNTFVSDHEKASPLLEPFASNLVDLLERRQKVLPTDGKNAADVLATTSEDVQGKLRDVSNGSLQLEGRDGRFVAYRAADAIAELCSLLGEWKDFYGGYDPIMTWWTSAPLRTLLDDLQQYIHTVREKIIGIGDDDKDTIVGQPVGRDALLASLETSFIAYSPEELIQLGEEQYAWCETEMLKASHDLGYGSDWKAALDVVKGMHVPPGQQIYMVHDLANEAIQYVKANDMVTVPKIAEECWRTYMLSPERQKANPFFLGGPYVQIAYPTDSMSHADKLMSMRGNSRPLSRSTVFHELIPGHHLQYHMMARHRPYRNLFSTPFWMEGWAFYWEFILWDRGFAQTPEEKIGMLFWRMHRCARIVFSLKFHMGQMTPQECIEYLVEKVGHERATAEGEVRRSFNGDYSPLYQAGYMLGALQFYALRKELVEEGGMKEKEFHDRVLREGQMPVEILRALLKRQELKPDHKASWRFYDFPPK